MGIKKRYTCKESVIKGKKYMVLIYLLNVLSLKRSFRKLSIIKENSIWKKNARIAKGACIAATDESFLQATKKLETKQKQTNRNDEIS